MKNNHLLLTGGTGLVGGRLFRLLSNTYSCLAPSRQELDITNSTSIESYLRRHPVDVIVHAAAFTDVTKAEKERGDVEGQCWKINVEGIKHIVHAANEKGIFVIFLSTGSVFSGTEKTGGSFRETDTVSPLEQVSWYGWTKSRAEELVENGAIIRLSHPIGGGGDDGKKDYVEKMIELYNHESLYPLFTDQVFPFTYIPDLALSIEKLCQTKQGGKFHIVSETVCSPYELMKYILTLQGKSANRLKQTTFAECISMQQYPLRFTQYAALDGTVTRETLHLPKRTWEEVVRLSI